MFLFLGCFLHLLTCVFRHMIPFLLEAQVSRGVSFSVVVCHVGCFLPAFPGVLFSLFCTFLAHEIHSSYHIGFHIFWGCQYFLGYDCNVLSWSSIFSDLWVHSSLVFACDNFYFSVPFSDLPFYCYYLLIQIGVVYVSVFISSSLQISLCLSLCYFGFLLHYSLSFMSFFDFYSIFYHLPWSQLT